MTQTLTNAHSWLTPTSQRNPNTSHRAAASSTSTSTLHKPSRRACRDRSQSERPPPSSELPNYPKIGVKADDDAPHDVSMLRILRRRHARRALHRTHQGVHFRWTICVIVILVN